MSIGMVLCHYLIHQGGEKIFFLQIKWWYHAGSKRSGHLNTKFGISRCKKNMVEDYFGREADEEWWRMVWSRNLFIQDIDFDNLLVLQNSFICGDREDWWVWRLGEREDFSVELAYALLEGLLMQESNRSYLEDRVFKLLQESPHPSKKIALS